MRKDENQLFRNSKIIAQLSNVKRKVNIISKLSENSMVQLFDFDSPSFIRDELEPKPAKQFKAVGSKKDGYYASYAGEELNWELYPKTSEDC